MTAPVAIVKGKDTLLYDEAGNTYIDAISSWWVTLHGHGNVYIAEKIYRQALQLEQVIFAGFTHQPAVELAEKLLPLLPGNFQLTKSDPIRGVITMLPPLNPTHTFSVIVGMRSARPDCCIQ